MATIDKTDLSSSSSHEETETRVLSMDCLSVCATAGHRTTGCDNCSCQCQYDDIFEWFKLKGIQHGNPEEILLKDAPKIPDRLETLSLGSAGRRGKAPTLWEKRQAKLTSPSS